MSDINEMNVGVRWYVAHTYSGYENKVKANIEKIVENRALGHLIFDVRIPVEKVIPGKLPGFPLNWLSPSLLRTQHVFRNSAASATDHTAPGIRHYKCPGHLFGVLHL